MIHICEPRFIPFHENKQETFWSGYCPMCKNSADWDINVKTEAEARIMWARTFKKQASNDDK
jgi:hypothetical protein